MLTFRCSRIWLLVTASRHYLMFGVLLQGLVRDKTSTGLEIIHATELGEKLLQSGACSSEEKDIIRHQIRSDNRTYCCQYHYTYTRIMPI